MSGASDKAIKAVEDLRLERDQKRRDKSTETFGHSGASIASCPPLTTPELLDAAHDPALGRDRSVCLREVVERFERERDEQLHKNVDNANAMSYALDVLDEFGAEPDA